MAKAKTRIPFTGTAGQEAALIDIMRGHNNDPGALMMVLQEAQELYGYLPLEVQMIIAENLGVSLSEVYGVVSFYAQFTLNPKGKYNIGVCLGTACYVKGASAIADRLCQELKLEMGASTPDGLFSIEATRCIGACGLAPAVMVNGDVHGRLVPDDAGKIIKKYS